MRYYASGETRLSTGNMFTDRLFTGQRQMAGLGIYQFGARFYSPELGRFLSADPMVPQPFNPQSLNRYSYALNNPLRYIDPSGHRICDDVDAYGNCITYDYGDDDSSGGSDGSTDGGGGGDDGSDGSGDGGGSSDGSGSDNEIADTLYLFGSIAQDLATFGDVLFVAGTTTAITVGCFAGPAGCLAAAVEAEVAYISGYNQVLNLLSGFSLLSTAAADLIDNRQFGEDTATSLVATVFGSAALDPFSSAAFNVYGSGYNHGYFNGVITLMNGGPLIKEN